MPQQPDAAPLDRRRPPFCYQTHAALDAIRARYQDDGAYGKLAVALAVYVVLTETANRLGGAPAREGFSATRAAIAEQAGISTHTFSRYAAELARAGVLEIEQNRQGDVSLPNIWTLVEPDGPVAGEGGMSVGAQGGMSVGAQERSKERTPRKPLAIARGSRRPNLPFDALVEACPGTDPAVDGGMIAKALKTIRQRLVSEAAASDPRGDAARRILAEDDPVGSTGVRLAEEVAVRARLYRERWPDVELTPTALAKHWTRVATPAPGRGRAAAREIATMFDAE